MRSSSIRGVSRACLGLVLSAACGITGSAGAQGTPIGFEERFALSTDRASTLAQLIPGTEDHFFFSCLLAQHEGRLDAVPPLLLAWIDKHGRTARVVEIENRQALLRYSSDPAATLKHLQAQLGLGFDDQRTQRGSDPALPTRLDPALISRETLLRRALTQYPGSLDGLTDAGLLAVAARELNDNQLVALLSRSQLPDLPNLEALVLRELRRPNSSGFGALPIHRRLTLAQLEACVGGMPALLNDARFVAAYLERLAPDADVDPDRDPAAREAWLQRLDEFTQRLGPVHVPLRANVLHARLAADLERGVVDANRLLAYLRLPRQGHWTNPEYLRRIGRVSAFVDEGRATVPGLPPIGSGEQLVRACLETLFVDAEGFETYGEYLDSNWLRRVFAETKILAGVGDMQRWHALLDDPGYYERLRDRVEIGFPRTSRSQFGIDEKVVIEADVKNVATLIVKVFEIDTFNWLRAQGREPDAAIELDGLVATEERTLRYDEAALRRVRRSFEFPAMDRPGVWVVEFIGNGIASRAVVRKGRLRCDERSGDAGHVFRVLDERGALVADARLWFAGREFAADAKGEIHVPYSTEPGRKHVVLRRGDFASLASFQHRAETYALSTGIWVEREALLPGAKAQVLLRARLALCDRPIPAALIEEPVLTITALGLDGVPTSTDVRGLELRDDRETVHEFVVPQDAASFTLQLRGRTKSLTTGLPVELVAPQRSFELNAIDATAETASPLLSRSREGFVLDVLGKNGEPKAGRAVRLRLQHREFTQPVELVLKTDPNGRIQLGRLEGIVGVRSDGFAREVGEWRIEPLARSVPAVLHGVAGETLRIPLPRPATSLGRAVASLWAVRGEADAVPVTDLSDRLTLVGNVLELPALAAGDYELWLERSHPVRVRITAGTRLADLAVGVDRILQAPQGEPLQVAGLEVGDGELRIALAGFGTATRVHVTATRYLAAWSPLAALQVPGDTTPNLAEFEFIPSSYHVGRAIADEYRYILERRFAAKYPGNLLRRPGLLLNPWAMDDDVSAVGLGGGAGGRFGGRSGGRGGGRSAAPASEAGPVAPGPGAYPNLAFLPAPARVLANLVPGADGIVRVKLSELGTAQHVHVLALDRESSVAAELPLDESPLTPRSRQLTKALDPAQPFAQRRRIEFVAAGATATIADLRTSEFTSYRTLGDVHRLFRTLSADPQLEEFAFVLRWPTLDEAEKRAQYSKHACHELHLFLYAKDRAFFDAVVRPYLANKGQRTFVDEYLLDADLAPFLEPRAFARLNVVERILLAQRLGAERESVARLVADAVELLPKDPARRDRLFRTALLGDVLAGGGYRGPADAMPEGGKESAFDSNQWNSAVGTGGGAGTDRSRARLPAPSRAPGAPPAAAPAEKPGEPALDAKRDEPRAEGRELDDLAKGEKDKAVQELAEGLVEDQRGAESLARRKGVAELYRPPETTKRFAESQYWHLPLAAQTAELVAPNAFWRDFARHDAGRPFVSVHVAEAIGSFAEMMLALAVLDLPFSSEPIGAKVDGNAVALTGKTGFVLVREEITAAQPAPRGSAPILVSQNFYRLDERYRFEGGEQRDAWVSEEFVVGVAYGCQVVVTNPTSTPLDLDVLLQIPQGAVPVAASKATRNVAIRLGGYATQSLEYAFYFPVPGGAPQYPVHVSHDGTLLAAAGAVTLNVVATPSKVDTSSWEHVSQDGSTEDVLRWLETGNLCRIDLGRIAWRMRDRAVFTAVIERLRRRHVHDDRLWSYAIHHGDERGIREYLRFADGFLANCGRAIVSPLVTLDPFERRQYEHVEFEPLFNARAHRFGRQREILNRGLAEQYTAFLWNLVYVPALDAVDWLDATYYLLLQDRIEEALASFARVDAGRLATKLQYDAVRAYLALYEARPAEARAIATRYVDHPVDRWRTWFRELGAQLDELEGKAVAGGEGDDRMRRQTQLAESQPSLEVALEGRRVALRYKNLTSCTVRYFVMDVEFLFSTHPFVQQGTGEFAYVRPNRADVLALPAGTSESAFDLPAEFHAANVLVEVVGGGITRRQAHYASTLAVRWMDGYGQLQVTDAASGRPLAKVYVKVFARLPGGAVRFHKDGYTDLRGRFDYVSVSGAEETRFERFSVLVLSDEQGASIRELDPPVR
ncbi:MAG: hypothetical protein IT457_13625 [Planctomycetes bacterium]|nr:hypothetical protein [Planctomycetota bacterium]